MQYKRLEERFSELFFDLKFCASVKLCHRKGKVQKLIVKRKWNFVAVSVDVKYCAFPFYPLFSLVGSAPCGCKAVLPFVCITIHRQ